MRELRLWIAQNYGMLLTIVVSVAMFALYIGNHSAGLTVVTRLRDEAHRFAIAYHRELRSRRIMESRLDEIPGIGASKKEALLKYFGSMARLQRASVQQIAEAPGIGMKTAELIRNELDKKG